MKQFTALLRLTAMRRRAGGSLPTSLRWATGLLWRDHQVTRLRLHLERSANIEHTKRQRP